MHRERTRHPGIYRAGDRFQVRDAGKWHHFHTFFEARKFKAEQRRQRNGNQHEVSRWGWIYLIGPAEGLIKIGFSSTHPARRRLQELQSGSPVQLELFGCRRAYRLDETELHERYAALRRHGEWFERTPELMREISFVEQEADDVPADARFLLPLSQQSGLL